MTERTKTCLITGANSGIGKAAAVQIAREGWRVVLGCRDAERGRVAREDVRRESNSDAVELLALDMSDRASIRRAASELVGRHGVLDAVVHNAAFFDYAQKEKTRTPDGVETTWATNHLGPVLLTGLLLPAIAASGHGRIIFVSSKGLALFPRLRVDVSDVSFERRRWTVTRAYYQSKLAQVVFAFWLSERMKPRGVTVNAIRVTNVRVDVDKRYPNVSAFARLLYSMKSRFSITPEVMAETYTWLVTADEVRDVTGGYFDRIGVPVRANRSAYDDAHAAEVMEVTRRALADERLPLFSEA